MSLHVVESLTFCTGIQNRVERSRIYLLTGQQTRVNSQSTSVSSTKQFVLLFFWSRPSGPEGHPDPDGFHLEIVCRIVREFLKRSEGW